MERFSAVAIDGPAGSGKSTIARTVAQELGFLYIDTGAMYRSVALKAKLKGVDLEDEAAMAEVAAGVSICFDATGTRVLLDGADVSEQIRTPEITAITKYAARVVAVRERMVELQRAMAANRPVVMEGRDITTVVLKEAKWRFFVTASAEERANRRFKEFKERGHDVDYDQLLSEIIARDESDNEVGPMKDALEIAHNGGGIVLVDTTLMSPAQVVDAIVDNVRANP